MNGSYSRASTLGFLGCLILAAPSAQAQDGGISMDAGGGVVAPAANDDFDSATVIGALPFTDAIDTRATTRAGDDPSPCGYGRTVWYAFTPASDMQVAIDSIGSRVGYGYVSLSVLTGSRGALSTVAADCYSNVYRALRLNLSRGVTYFFMSDDPYDIGGDLVLNVVEIVPPANDDIANARAVDPAALPFSDTVDVTGATQAPGDPVSCGSGPNIWYRVTPSSSRRFFATASSSRGGYTPISIFSGSPGALALSSCLGSSGGVDLIAGTTYYLMVNDYYGSGGSLTFTLEEGLNLTVGIGSDGLVDTRTGIAKVGGTVGCNLRTSFLSVSGVVRQKFGRTAYTVGSFSIALPGCTPPSVAWEATVIGDRPFVAGSAIVSANAYGCGARDCNGAAADGTQRLRNR